MIKDKPTFICMDCGTSKLNMPMVTHDLWNLFVEEKDRRKYLCLHCFEKRMGRLIRRTDLLNCLWNEATMVLVARTKAGLF